MGDVVCGVDDPVPNIWNRIVNQTTHTLLITSRFTTSSMEPLTSHYMLAYGMDKLLWRLRVVFLLTAEKRVVVECLEPHALVVCAVRGTADLPKLSSPRHPHLQVVLVVRRGSQLLRGHLQHSVGWHGMCVCMQQSAQ